MATKTKPKPFAVSEQRVTALRIQAEVSRYDDKGRVRDRKPVQFDMLEAEIPDEIMKFVQERLKGSTNG